MLEQAVQFLIKNVFEDYVNGLEKSKGSGGACEFNNLTLKVQKINDELDEDGNSPFSIDSGKVAMVSLQPTWMGGVNLKIDGLEIGLSFNALKLLSLGMNTITGQAEGATPPQTPPASERRHIPHALPQQQYNNIPASVPQYNSSAQPSIPSSKAAAQASNPTTAQMMYGSGIVTNGQQFCPDHITSEKRTKGEPCVKPCMSCKQNLQTNYVQFTYCPQCSGSQLKCMICGDDTVRRGPPTPSARELNGSNGVPSSSQKARAPMRNGYLSAPHEEDRQFNHNGSGSYSRPSTNRGMGQQNGRLTEDGYGEPISRGTVVRRAQVVGARRRDDCPTGRSVRSQNNANRIPRDMQVDCGDYAQEKGRHSFSASSDAPACGVFGNGSTSDTVNNEQGIFNNLFGGTPTSNAYGSSQRNEGGVKYSAIGRNTADNRNGVFTRTRSADVNGKYEQGGNSNDTENNNWWFQGANSVQNMSANMVYNMTLGGCTPQKVPDINNGHPKQRYYN